MRAQRDAFINSCYQAAVLDKDIMFLSADFGAPALDAIRSDLPGQFIHVGISEQNMIDTAIGLALRGKKVFTYAMAPFLSMRPVEQHKIASMMNTSICNIVAGVGLGYANAGPTHYATEDFAVLSNIIGGTVYTCSDSQVAAQVPYEFLKTPSYTFVRLDREVWPDLGGRIDLDVGFRVFKRLPHPKVALVSQGYASSLIYSSDLIHDLDVDHVDIFRSKPLSNELIRTLGEYDSLIVVDEQIQSSSLGAYLAGFFSRDANKSPVVVSVALRERFVFENLGRAQLAAENGVNIDTIKSAVMSAL